MTMQRQQVDPLALARDLRLDPQRVVSGEARIRCPQGCDEGRKRTDLGCSLHVGGGDKCGVWQCFRCGEGGHITQIPGASERAGAMDKGWTPPPPRPPVNPIDVEQAWADLHARSNKEDAARWAQGRGWPQMVAEAFAELPDVLVSPAVRPDEGEAGRMWDHAENVRRPVLFATRDKDGRRVSIQRRCFGSPRDGMPKAMAGRKDLFPCEGPRILGDVTRWESSEELYLVEGEADWGALASLLSMWSLTHRDVIGAPSCRQLLPVARAALSHLEHPESAHVVIIPHLGDTDDIGLGCAREAAELLASRVGTVELLMIPGSGERDLAGLLEAEGVRGVDQLLEEGERERVSGGFGGGDGDEPPPGGGGGGGGPLGPNPPPHSDADLDGIWWTRDREGVEWGLEVGQAVAMHRREGESHQRWIYGRQIWATGCSVDVLDGSTGLMLEYEVIGGGRRSCVLPSRSWVDKSPARSAACALADKGVQVEPGQGEKLILTLGKVATRHTPTTHQTITRPGWHEGVWVNGPRVHGASWEWAGEEGEGGRGEVRGTVEDWRAHVAPLVTTPGLRFALGVALSGACLEPLGRPSFMVHLSGGSSSGKSKAGALAQSVYGPPSMLSWDSTVGALTARLEAWSGAAVVLDEVGQMAPYHVGKFVHGLSSGIERDRLTRSSDLRRRRRWSLAVLSTGEVTLCAHLGQAAQGGHSVRGMDVRICRGELTHTAPHADALDRACGRFYGALGDAWGAKLQTLTPEQWEEIAQQVDALATHLDPQTDAETTRIVRQVALVGVALALCAEWGIGPDMGAGHAHATAAAQWAVHAICTQRGAVTSPEARAWAGLQGLYETQPYRFPPDDVYREQGSRDVVGVSEQTAGATGRNSTGAIFTTSTMLAVPEVLGQCSPQELLEWATGKGLARVNTTASSGKSRVAGQVRKWWWLGLGVDFEGDQALT